VKNEYKLFLYLAGFFAPVGIFYGIFTHWEEPVGPAGLFLSAGLGLMVAFYLWATSRRLPERPEDNPSGEIAEQEGEYGFFSPHSWWPLALGGAAALCFLGLAVGWWLFIIGASFGTLALVGWTFEYFKGPHAV
jgi:hypothetical protein